ncbi:hypothetical protein CRU96_06865 [Malaciobacter halophilus]|nr:replication initiation protein [Malaciobacter halophilus]RYA23596.1 hypothetical protein CRU96_06865 [Malaciobacter halophilus]
MGKENPTKKQQIIAEQQKIFKNRKVVQLNRFIKGDVSAFSVNDLKIFKLIISKVDSKESLFKDFYEITTDEIKALNINSKHLYNETRKTLKRLANIYITFDEGDSVREVGLIRNDFKFEKYSKKILINFNDDMGEYLVNLKKNFFMYDLIDIVNFKFKHTLKFYEYLKSQSLNVIKLKLETLKEILDLTDKYKRYTNFKSDVLEVILEEINECSNTLYVSFSEEKVGPKVKYIIFHIKRIKSDLVIDAPRTSKNKYFDLIGLECEYLNKYQTIENIDLKHNLIVLKEIHTENYTNIVKDSEEGLADTLKSLLGSIYDERVGQGEQDEVQRLLAAKDFKKFKDEVIKQYKGKLLCNNVPGYLPEVKISVEEETGYLFNEHTAKILTKEKSLEVWRYLYKNKVAVGKLVEINPVKEFIDIEVLIQKTNLNGNKESIKYIITDIQEESENDTQKYRLYLQDALDPLQEIEKSKSLLTLEQLKKFVETSKVED